MIKHFFIGLGFLFLIKQITEFSEKFSVIDPKYLTDKLSFFVVLISIFIIYLVFTTFLGSCIEDIINWTHNKLSPSKKEIGD